MNLFGFGGGCGWGGWGNLGNFGCFGGGMPFFGGGMPFFGGGMNFGFPSISNWWNNSTNNNTKNESSTISPSTTKSTTETTPASTSTTSTTSTSTSTQTPITPTTETSTDKATTQETTDTKGKAEEKSYGYTGKTVDQLVDALDEDNIDDLEEGAQSEFEQAFHADLDKMENDNNQGNIENYVNILNQIIDTPNIEKKLGRILKLAAENTCAVLKAKIDGRGSGDTDNTEVTPDATVTTPTPAPEVTTRKDYSKLKLENIDENDYDKIKPDEARKILGNSGRIVTDEGNNEFVKVPRNYKELRLAAIATNSEENGLRIQFCQNTEFTGKVGKSDTIKGTIISNQNELITYDKKENKYSIRVKDECGTYALNFKFEPSEEYPNGYVELAGGKNGGVYYKNKKNDLKNVYTGTKYKINEDKEYATRASAKPAVGV